MNVRKSLLGVAFLAFASGSANAAIILTTNGSGDQVDWGQLGPVGTPVASGTAFTTAGGVQGVVTFGGSGTGAGVYAQGVNWNGDFHPNQSILFSGFNGATPIILTFNTPLASFTEDIQANFFGAFTAQLDAYSGVTLLGSFFVNGNSSSTPDTASALGVLDDVAEIDKIVYSVTSCTLSCDQFAIGGAGFGTSSRVPEPLTLSVFAAGLVGAAAMRRRKKKSA
ncbi:MAG TPA: PEP-CTERM sorting domain-containing protein [Rhizomicrobium sp.]|nr:PEP-CTERM sorting domain-containing protein [Rhizomicrobium sp.]